jgi:Xaa-Pro aminopeptidase
LAERDIDAMLLTPGSDLFYLTGYHALPAERLTCLVLRKDDEPRLIVPALERDVAEDSIPSDLGIELDDLGETGDATALMLSLIGPAARVAIDNQMWAERVLWLQNAVGVSACHLASELLSPMRQIKDAYEQGELRAAGAAIDRVHEQVPRQLVGGRTEAEVASSIATAIVDAGHATCDFVIVGAGENGAKNHHQPGSRVLREGDAVVVDIGGTLPTGYASDCTRTYVLGQPGSELLEMYAVLEHAQATARAAARVGVACEAVDAAARDVISAAGFGEYFNHRLGHGIGLDTHEPPYLVEGNRTELASGMAFSIEPGIYLPGRAGARIEDIMIVGEDSSESVNNVTRSLVSVDC